MKRASMPMQKHRNALGGLVAIAALAVPVAGLAGQDRPAAVRITVAEAQMSELRRMDGLVDALARNDELVLASRTADRFLPERVHEGLVQYHQGVLVVGGGISRQLADGVTVSIFGTLHEGIDVGTTPLVPADDALALIVQQAGAGPATQELPSLVILPTRLDAYVLAWRMPMDDGWTYYLDARRGRIVHEESNVFEQSASVGVGAGIQGQRKKLSTSEGGGQYQAYDRLRPAETVTLDMRHDRDRTNFLLLRPEGIWAPSDVASAPDNDWTDAAVVDAHAYAGFTYDYLAQVQGWNGMNGKNGRLMSMVNVSRTYHNASFWAPPYGPEETGAIVFGEFPDGTPLVSADIVAHEIMHGVTYFSVRARTGEGLGGTRWFPGPSEFTLSDGFTVRCGETYTYPEGWSSPVLTGISFGFVCDEAGRLVLHAAHGGAVNEAYSDILATAVEFMVHEPPMGPLRADYRMGEDTGERNQLRFRRIDDPGSLPLASSRVGNVPLDVPYPDAFSGMVWFLEETFEYSDRTYVVASRIGTVDGGRTFRKLPSWSYSGSHWNSTILSHAFYLAIEGGRNRTTGLTVQGVGGANRHDVERAFLRAMIHLMPSTPLMPTAASVVLQSAADLFGPGSATHEAIEQALVAVGLLRPVTN